MFVLTRGEKINGEKWKYKLQKAFLVKLETVFSNKKKRDKKDNICVALPSLRSHNFPALWREASFLSLFSNSESSSRDYNFLILFLSSRFKFSIKIEIKQILLL